MHLELLPRTELTLRVLLTIARGGRWRASDIATAVGSSPHYVARLVPPLSRAGWIRSTPGPAGGHELIVDPADISVIDLIDAVEGPVDKDRCVLVDRPCPAAEPCALHEAWVPARDRMIERLGETPLSSLVHDTEVTS